MKGVLARMEKLICSCCCATLVPNIDKPFLTCEYCDANIPNPYYDETAAAEAAKPDLTALCLTALKEMGAAQNLARLDQDCFGDPIEGVDTARAGLQIDDADRIYFLYTHSFLLLVFHDGLALTDSGLYYKDEEGEGRLSWEAFVTSPISCVDRAEDQDGTLRIGSSIELPVKSDKDASLARFLVDYHNHVYRLHTGETAPATWAVTEPVVAVQTAAVPEKEPSLLNTVLPAVGALLGGSVLNRQNQQTRQTILRRTPTLHPTGHPTLRQDRNARLEPARPLYAQPHHRKVAPNRPAAPNGMDKFVAQPRPGAIGRPGNPSRPDGMGKLGGQPRPGAIGRPGNPNRPGAMGSGRREPGGMGRPGGPGKGRR